MSAEEPIPISQDVAADHGAPTLLAVTIDSYNEELRDSEGFVGDRASARAFRAILADERERAAKGDEDPIGEVPSEEISKKKLDKVISEGDPEAAGIVFGTIEEFSQEFAAVIRRFLRLQAWENTERIVIGGGLRASRIGELAIGRTAVLLKKGGASVELRPIHQHPDEAGLVGAAHLAPPWIFKGHEAIFAVDIGGSNIRAGIVELNAKKDSRLSKAKVLASELWRHADEETDRNSAVDRLNSMLRDLITYALKRRVNVAPYIGVGCPGLIGKDGSIEKGGQNLPGDWEHRDFNLPALITAAIPTIENHDVVVLMHNDAVVQGLSEVPFMADVTRWGVMTMGTGLGNARFTNRKTGNSRDSNKQP